MIYILSVIGWPVLWFKPDWRWFAAIAVIVLLPGVAYTVYTVLEVGAGWRSILPNVIDHLPFPLVVFCVPAAAIVALRQRMHARKDAPTPPG